MQLLVRPVGTRTSWVFILCVCVCCVCGNLVVIFISVVTIHSIIELFYRLVNNIEAIPAAIPTAAATVTPPMAASFNFRLSSCSILSILAKCNSRANRDSG